MTRGVSKFLTGSVGLYLGVRYSLESVGVRGGYVSDSPYLTVLASLRALYRYVRLHLVPFRLNVNPDLGGGLYAAHEDILESAVASLSLGNGRVLITLGLLCGVAYVLRRSYKREPLFAYMTLWFFVALLPVSNFVPGPLLFAERYAYVATLGFSFVLCLAIQRACDRWSLGRTFSCSLVVVVCLCYTAIVRNRNTHWKDPIALWEETVQRSAGSSLVLNNLALAYWEVGRTDEALAVLRRVISVNPAYERAYNNYGMILADREEYREGLLFFLKATELNPSYGDAYLNLGTAHLALGLSEEAVPFLERAGELLHPEAGVDRLLEMARSGSDGGV